jgi:lipoyl(octanoyl) transferase
MVLKIFIYSMLSMTIDVVVLKGFQDYKKMLDKQFETLNQVRDNLRPDTLLLLEHSPVITLGRRTEENHLVLSKADIESKNIDVYNVERGGSATYHGPGQLVGYFICRVSKYGGTNQLVTRVLNLVQKIISQFGLESVIDKSNPGIWTVGDNPRKLAAVGMQIKEGYSLHGFALNVDVSLIPYTYIVPCGLTLPITSLSLELGKKIEISTIMSWTKENAQKILSSEIIG